MTALGKRLQPAKTLLDRFLKLFQLDRGVCRYCGDPVEPAETICDLCWANNSAW
jgi:predicted amidophosphoribosyltransferase